MTYNEYDRLDSSNISNACPSCQALMINRIYCHETRCPDAWRSRPVACFQCGYDFIPDERGQRTCKDCQQGMDV